MLAVYDAESGALRDPVGKLSQTDLYERLVQRFVRREVSKRDPDGGEDDAIVDRELLLLSVIAFGMFNRGTQWITDSQLADDMTALQLALPVPQAVTEGHRRLSGPAKDALGRFFFIHRAKTSIDEVEFGTYEFLHANFGEYLVIRLIWRCLMDMIDRAHMVDTAIFSAQRRVDDAQLRAFLSWTVLSVRATTMHFFDECVASLSDERRASMRAMVLAAFHGIQRPEDNVAYQAYSPVEKTQTARLATYSANLVLLIVSIDLEVSSDELYPLFRDRADEWRRTAQFWQSQLTSEEWRTLIDMYVINRRVSDDGGRSVCLGKARATNSTPRPANFIRPHEDSLMAEYGDAVPLNAASFMASADLICDPGVDLAIRALGGRGEFFRNLFTLGFEEVGKPTSFGFDMHDALVFHGTNASVSERMEIYERLVTFCARDSLANAGTIQPIASQVLYMLTTDSCISTDFILRQLGGLTIALKAPDGGRNLELLLRLLEKSYEYEPLLIALNELLLHNDTNIEQIAEVWCALAEKCVPKRQFPEKILHQANLLRWPDRSEFLAHRPDLLQRLSTLDDEKF
ncbi:hypothetical protein [Amycolatopsis magusensis]|uniref:hypothetical protein n=1 Tax=Amycolatopsis magusensis TaxID=882444 RepID=UPI003C302A4D